MLYTIIKYFYTGLWFIFYNLNVEKLLVNPEIDDVVQTKEDWNKLNDAIYKLQYSKDISNLDITFSNGMAYNITI